MGGDNEIFEHLFFIDVQERWIKIDFGKMAFAGERQLYRTIPFRFADCRVWTAFLVLA